MKNQCFLPNQKKYTPLDLVPDMSLMCFWTLSTIVGRLPVFLQGSAQSQDTQGKIVQSKRTLLSLFWVVKQSLYGITSQLNVGQMPKKKTLKVGAMRQLFFLYKL